MRISTNNHGTRTVCADTKQGEEFLKFLFDALEAKYCGCTFYTNFPWFYSDEILAISKSLEMNHIQSKKN